MLLNYRGYFINSNFTAKLTQLGGQKVEQFTVTDAGGAAAAKQKLERDANGMLVVANTLNIAADLAAMAEALRLLLGEGPE